MDIFNTNKIIENILESIVLNFFILKVILIWQSELGICTKSKQICFTLRPNLIPRKQFKMFKLLNHMAIHVASSFSTVFLD